MGGTLPTRAPKPRTVVNCVLAAIVVASFTAQSAHADPGAAAREASSEASIGCFFEIDGQFLEADLTLGTSGNEASISYGNENYFVSGTTDTVELTGTLSKGSAFTTTVPLFDWATGEFIGTATFDGTLAVIGPAWQFVDTSRFAMGKLRFYEVIVAGTLTIDDGGLLGQSSFALTGCEGGFLDAFVAVHLPDTVFPEWNVTNLSCSLQATDGSRLQVNGVSDPIFPSGNILQVSATYAPPDSAKPVLTASGDGQLALEGPLEGVFAEMLLFADGVEEPAGLVGFDGSATEGASISGRRITQDVVENMTLTELDLVGEVFVTVGEVSHRFSLSDCAANRLHVKRTRHDPAAPKSAWPAPSNDTPEDAQRLQPGDVYQGQTGSAAIAAEAPCVFDWDGAMTDQLWGRTVWFTVAGTGDALTIDPAGSDFDTSVAAYVSTAGGLEHIGCVDDDFGDPFLYAQEALTISTEPGVTYFIQVGGVDYGAWVGSSSDPQYGRLRLKVY